jgi:DNA-binding MarR family transcriptional regulator
MEGFADLPRQLSLFHSRFFQHYFADNWSPEFQESILEMSSNPDHTVPTHFGINKTEISPHMALHRDGPMTIHVVGGMVGIPKNKLTSVVNRLIRSELVQRSEYPKDKHKVLVGIH